MIPPATPHRARAREVVGALVTGLVLVFGGTCGVGPTSLALAAVSANHLPVPDDARSQAPALAAAEPAAPTRRIVRRRVGRLARRLVTLVPRAAASVVASVRTPRAPPPLRGPPLLLH